MDTYIDLFQDSDNCLLPLQCLSLLLWLEDRYETVYMRHPGFQKGAKPLLALDNPFPMNLPDNLYGDRWAFVQLPFSGKQLDLSITRISTKYFCWHLGKRVVHILGLNIVGVLGIDWFSLT